MGHDITGRIKGEFEEVAYLRIGAFNSNKAFFFYDAIQSNECNGGVSGNGNNKTFTNEELKKAKGRLNYMLGESKDDIEIVAAETFDKIRPVKELIEEAFKIDMGNEPPELSDVEKKYIKESIEDFLDKLIDTGKDISIDFF